MSDELYGHWVCECLGVCVEVCVCSLGMDTRERSDSRLTQQG